MARVGRDLDLDVWVKRDDLTGTAVTGNKVRKLEFLVAAALQERADVLVTCGAVNSNHARATAVSAARMGITSHLLLRGEPDDPPGGNLLLDRYLGAETTFITPDEWPDRDGLMQDIVARLAAEGRRGYAIPEGGSNGLGCLGYVVGALEILEQARVEGIDVRRIVHASGSGGTTAGLALGVAAAEREDVEVVGVAVCDDAAYFDARVGEICDEAAEAGYVTPALRERTKWRIVEGYKGAGYGKTTPEDLQQLAAVARKEGVFLDPVYTGKAWQGLVGEAKAGRLGHEGSTVFLHTGGIFGLFAYATEIAAL
jgi:D-cysteine desulfhydrase